MDNFNQNNGFNTNGQQSNTNDNQGVNDTSHSYYNQPDYNTNAYNQSNMNEYSFNPQPQKPKKSKKRLLTAVVAVLCVFAIGTTSIVGYSLITGNKLDITSSDDSSSSSSSTKKSDSNSAVVSTVDRGNLPTLEQLATPSDAMSIPDIVTKVSPSVVGISCNTAEGTCTGTGIIMSEDGYIITNAHVVADATDISVVLSDDYASGDSSDDSSTTSMQFSSDDEDLITAELVGIDTQSDIAVIKIEKTGLTAAEFGTSADLQVGEISIVIGNPLGFDLAGSVTAGIISATNRELTIEDRTMNLIQTDASINSGNSGGPLINAYGQVIGITSAKVASTYGEGLGFAIPIDEAIPIVDDLLEYGYVTGRPTVGISGTDVTEVYSQYYDIPMGFFVAEVTSGGPAEQAGIEVGDVIVGINGTTIESISEFNDIKEQYKAGDTITVAYYRDGKISSAEIVLGDAADTSSTTTDDSSTTTPDNNTQGYGNYGNGFGQFYGN